MSSRGVKLAGTGMCVPALRVGSDDLDATAGRPAGWLTSHCGVDTRYVCHNETQDGMAASAARDALAVAGVGASDLDLIIAANSVARQPIPATAPLIARRLGLTDGRCASFDVNATCLSFLTGLDIAAAYIAQGRYRSALIVSSEIASRALPWETAPETAGLFGDGAAAAVLTQSSHAPTLIRTALFETHPDGYELCQIEAGGTAIDFRRDPERFAAGSLFQMDGRKLFRLTAERFPDFLDRLLAAASWSRTDVDLIVPHQASGLALKHLSERCGFESDKIVDIVKQFGNQVAASIPTALHIALTSKRVGPGAKILMLGTSAGVMFGGLAIEL